MGGYFLRVRYGGVSAGLGLQTLNAPQQFKTKRANVHANPGGFKRLLCVLHKAKAGPQARPLFSPASAR